MARGTDRDGDRRRDARRSGSRQRPTLPVFRRRLRRATLPIALAAALFPSRALAHTGHPRHDPGGTVGLPATLALLGGVLVVAGLALDRSGDVPRQYVSGLVLGGAALVLVVAPVLWFA